MTLVSEMNRRVAVLFAASVRVITRCRSGTVQFKETGGQVKERLTHKGILDASGPDFSERLSELFPVNLLASVLAALSIRSAYRRSVPQTPQAVPLAQVRIRPMASLHLTRGKGAREPYPSRAPNGMPRQWRDVGDSRRKHNQYQEACQTKRFSFVRSRVGGPNRGRARITESLGSVPLSVPDSGQKNLDGRSQAIIQDLRIDEFLLVADHLHHGAPRQCSQKEPGPHFNINRYRRTDLLHTD